MLLFSMFVKQFLPLVNLSLSATTELTAVLVTN